jgi:hypothetical protein
LEKVWVLYDNLVADGKLLSCLFHLVRDCKLSCLFDFNFVPDLSGLCVFVAGGLQTGPFVVAVGGSAVLSDLGLHHFSFKDSQEIML